MSSSLLVTPCKASVAVIGLIGVVVGSVLTILGNVVVQCLKERSIAKKRSFGV